MVVFLREHITVIEEDHYRLLYHWIPTQIILIDS